MTPDNSELSSQSESLRTARHLQVAKKYQRKRFGTWAAYFSFFGMTGLVPLGVDYGVVPTPSATIPVVMFGKTILTIAPRALEIFVAACGILAIMAIYLTIAPWLTRRYARRLASGKLTLDS